MQKLKDPATQNLMYPTLCRLAKHVDLIPHSNAYCETLFSMVKKTYHRYEESATSVYSDVHGIRNTLCGLLTTKINVFKKTECHEWNPSNDLLKRAKSATYEALNH